METVILDRKDSEFLQNLPLAGNVYDLVEVAVEVFVEWAFDCLLTISFSPGQSPHHPVEPENAGAGSITRRGVLPGETRPCNPENIQPPFCKGRSQCARCDGHSED